MRIPTYHSTQKRAHITVAVVVVGMLVGYAYPLLSTAATSAGWYSARSEHMGTAPECSSGEVRMDVALKEYGSFADIDPAGVRIKLQVFEDLNDGVVRETGWSTGTGVSPAVCYDLQDEAVKPIIEVIDGSSPYRAYEQAVIQANPYDTYEDGEYFRAYIHLMRTNDSDGYTVEALSPVEQIHNTDPGYSMRVAALPEQYDTFANSQLDDLYGVMVFLRRDDIEGLSEQFGSLTSSGAYSSHSFGPYGLTEDGYYAWTTFYVLDNEITFGGNVKSQSIASGSAYPYPTFLLDRTSPDTTISLTEGENDDDGQDVTITNAVRDDLSGLTSTTLYIDGSPVSDHTFTVGSGVTGGPKNLQEVDFSITLPPGATYTIYTRTEDAAGNVVESNTIEYTVPAAEPDTFPDLLISSDPAVGSVSGGDTETGTYDEVVFTFGIGNEGDESTSEQAATVAWELDRYDVARDEGATHSSTVGAIDAGSARTANAAASDVAFGVYELTATADPAALIDESNTTNNTVGPVEVFVPPPDPGLSLTFSNNPVRVGDAAELVWSREAEYPMECSLRGPALLEDENDPDSTTWEVVFDENDTSGTVTTGPRYNSARYMLRCIEPLTAGFDPDQSSFATDAVLEVIPQPQEL